MHHAHYCATPLWSSDYKTTLTQRGRGLLHFAPVNKAKKGRRMQQPCGKLPRVKKGLLLGILVLLVVDILWVGSAGLTRVSET